MTPAEIKKTRLYRTVAPCVRKEDREELARMLAMAPAEAFASLGYIRGLASSRLSFAFWWDETPQGADYWADLSRSLRIAGHRCW